jgi:hypothetical protein
MEKPNLYKKKALNEIRIRKTFTPTEEELNRSKHVINKFFELFKNKHL